MPPSSAPASDPPPPDATWRDLVSLGLVIHFFGVGLALISYTESSPLQQRVLKVLPYLTWLDFDLRHAYPSPARLHQTHAREDDIDFSAQVTADLPDGQKLTVTIPPADVWPGARRRRYQSLANAMGSVAISEDKKGKAIETALPKAFAASVLRPHGAKLGEIVITSRNLPSMEDLKSPRAEFNDPNNARYFRKVYEAKVIATKDSVALQKPSAAFEVAPLNRDGKRSGAGKTPSPPGAKP